MAYDLHDRILGSLVTAGMGDGVGVPSEAMSRAEILEEFGKPIDKFLEPGDNPYGLGNVIGEVTDDTSQMYEMAKAVIATKGELTVKAAADALVNWTKCYPKYYPRNAGPTMRFWVEDYMRGGDPLELARVGKVYGRGISNGCAMRVASAGLCNPGDLDGAIRTAVTMTSVSHGTQHAYSGACAIACAIAEAMTEHSDVSSVLKAAIYGTKEGEKIGLKKARSAYGPRVLPKLMQAIDCIYRADNADEASRLIEENVGCTGDIQPTIGVTLGLFAANDGDPIKTILAAANIGGDTDTFACIAGMVAGAYRGFHTLPQDWYAIFKAANPMLDFEWAAEELTKIAKIKMQRHA
ncbi:MAG TPA: ADP-ribosylglycohydrolase family protein [Clostridia bacterium]|nr:ADP-ribosylglycohydrolase family protein [Clostridia bacterium]